MRWLHRFRQREFHSIGTSETDGLTLKKLAQALHFVSFYNGNAEPAVISLGGTVNRDEAQALLMLYCCRPPEHGRMAIDAFLLFGDMDSS
jgi:hypothetical protein